MIADTDIFGRYSRYANSRYNIDTTLASTSCYLYSVSHFSNLYSSRLSQIPRL